MKKDINKKLKGSNIMKRFSIIFFLMLFSFSNIFSSQTDQNYILNFNLDERTGNIAFDKSSNGFIGVLSNGANFETVNVAFGSSDVDFDGGNDQIQTNLNDILSTSDTLSFSLWFKSDTNADDTLMNIFSDSGNLDIRLEVDVNQATDLLELKGVSNTGISFNYQLDNTGNLFNTGTYNNIILTYNKTSNEWKYYRNSVLINTLTIPEISFNTGETFTMILGTDKTSTLDFDGDLDEIKIFDFVLNQTQVNDLYNTNTVTLKKPEVNIITQPQTIFISYSPVQNQSLENPITFTGNLNYSSTCDLYIDNNLEKTFTNIISYSYDKVLNIGEHSYIVYCSYTLNNTQYFEVTDNIKFNVVSPGETSVTFNIIGTDFDISQTEMWIVSPCLKKGYSAIGTNYTPYRSVYNPNGAYFGKVVNGVATLNVTSGTNEFCLMNGRIIVNGDGKTNQYDIVENLGVLKLGNINVPRDNGVFTIKVGQFEVYDALNPKAYGKTWDGLAGAIILVIMGSLILFAGVRVANGKIVIAGTLIFLAGFGIGVNGLLGILI